MIYLWDEYGVMKMLYLENIVEFLRIKKRDNRKFGRESWGNFLENRVKM